MVQQRPCSSSHYCGRRDGDDLVWCWHSIGGFLQIWQRRLYIRDVSNKRARSVLSVFTTWGDGSIPRYLLIDSSLLILRRISILDPVLTFVNTE